MHVAPALVGAQPALPVPWPMTAEVRLRVPGNSRFAVDVAGRDTVLHHLAALGLPARSTADCAGPFAVRTGETAWLTGARLDAHAAPEHALVLVHTDTTGSTDAITVLFHDEPRIARTYPRDDGVVRTSLAEQRNRRAVQRLHGEGAAVRILAASGTRVFVTVPDGSQDGSTWRLIAYTFDAGGTVRSLTASAALPARSP